MGVPGVAAQFTYDYLAISLPEDFHLERKNGS